MLEIGQNVRATCEKLIFHGTGLIRHEGWVIFVEDILPGEEVVVQIVQKKKSYYTAKLVELLTSSPERVKPLCQYFGVCGGCQLQHLAYEGQLKAKEEWVNEALAHKIRLKNRIQIKPAEKEWAYRRKVTLHFTLQNGKMTLGYYARDNKTLLDIESCPIFMQAGDTLFSDVRKFLVDLQAEDGMKGDVTILKGGDEGYLLRFFFSTPMPKKAKKDMPLNPNWAKVWIESAREKIEIGKHPLLIDALGLKICISPKVFLQNYPEQSLRLYQDVMEMIPPSLPVLDLYCGVGILSLLLGQKGHLVTAIESNKEAIQLAKKSANYNQVENVVFIAGQVEDELKRAVQDKKFPVWVVNPPREGLSDKMVEDIFKLQPEYLIYVSCMPSTLARDLAGLCFELYECEMGHAYDMFPQTTHVETAVLLKKRK